MKKLITVFCFISISLIACTDSRYKFSEHDNTIKTSGERGIKSELCLYSCPIGTATTNTFVNHHIYILSLNRDTKFADWVAYEVRPENLHGGTHRRNWARDPDLSEELAFVPDDYTGANAAYGYDRGHQAPLADFSNHPEWAKTNYLSNITPQRANLNQGAWARLENQERKLADQGNVVYVLTGTVYMNEMDTLPHAHLSHIVPSGYWKIIAIENESDDTLKVASFYLGQNTPRREDFCVHSTSLEEIESLTGLQFFKDYPYPTTSSLLSALGC